jgi:hypothetical protein
MHAYQPKISLTGGEESSGLAAMLSQYFEQNLRDFPHKRRQAQKICGKLSVEALEGGVEVTIGFRDGAIEIADGSASDAKISVCGGIFSLTELATGGTGALGKIVRGELRVRAAWRHPIFAYRVARFMSLPNEMKSETATFARPFRWKLALGAGVIAAAAGLAAYLLVR